MWFLPLVSQWEVMERILIFCRVLFLVGRIGPLVETWRFLLRLNKGFRLFKFLQSASWIWITESDFLFSANVIVSCNVLTRWAHNLEFQMNLTGFVYVPCNWGNKFHIQCSERRVFLRLALNFDWFPNSKTDSQLPIDPDPRASFHRLHWDLKYTILICGLQSTWKRIIIFHKIKIFSFNIFFSLLFFNLKELSPMHFAT